ncbi:MAG TPA: iron-containing alcohol dehydrogenase [Anaerolineae bacterium]|nr:iron-containing alcohol dehydrogenase [Anaerolineae bacterium]
MQKGTKVVVWGGSAVATPELVDVLSREAVEVGPIDLVLVGRTKEKLEIVGTLCRRMAGRGEADLSVSFTTDMEAALADADYIINQIRVGGMEARAFDESFPRRFGIPGEETVGPGGFANALRTVPVVINCCRLVEKLAPQAVLLNLTNPSSLVQYAIRRYTDVRVIGVCDSPVSLMEAIAQLLDIPLQELSFSYVGMHHFGWITRVLWKGQDMMPQVLSRVDEIPKLEMDPEILQAIGAIPSPYLKYYFHPDRILAKTEGRPTRAEELIGVQAAMLEQYKGWTSPEKPDTLVRRGAVWYRKIVVPVLLAMIKDTRQLLIVSVDNGSAIPWLPEDTVVELPAIVGTDGARPLATGEVPMDVKAMVQMNAAYEMLAVEAIVERSYEKAFRALMANWMVHNAGQAKGILDLIWPEDGEKRVQVVREATKAEEIVFPNIVYGSGILREAPLQGERFVVVTMEEPWELAKGMLPAEPAAVAFVRDMDWDAVEKLERAIPAAERVVGIGGGSALDMAKYVAWRRNLPCDLIPSISSVDTFATKSIAVRERGHVRYIGFIVPKNVYVDYELIRQAPPRLNRAGVGDIISAHTALWDWALAHERRGERYDEGIVATFRDLLAALDENAPDIRRVSEKGVHFIMDAYSRINLICRRLGSSRPQEGAEHTFAYNAEYLTRRHYIHGELVALGTLVIAAFQDNEWEWVQEILDRCGVLYQPRDLGISQEEFVRISRSLNSYSRKHGRRYTVLDDRPLDEGFIEEMCSQLTF